MRGSQIAAAAAAREALSGRVRAFFGSHDLLLCPVSMVAPFDVGVRWGDTPLLTTSGASLRSTACATAGVARCLMGSMLFSMPPASGLMSLLTNDLCNLGAWAGGWRRSGACALGTTLSGC